MAKLNAPLFSFNASGKIAKALVYFSWKGLDVVRSYVVPTNPKTTAQELQRSYVTAAVAAIHAAEQDDTYPLLAIDKIAYALRASTRKTPSTWFNEIVKERVLNNIADDYNAIFSSASLAEVSTQVTFLANLVAVSPEPPTDGDIYWGTSKTALHNIVACTIAELAAGKAITGLTNGTKYFFQYRGNDPSHGIARSGIYTQIPRA